MELGQRAPFSLGLLNYLATHLEFIGMTRGKKLLKDKANAKTTRAERHTKASMGNDFV